MIIRYSDVMRVTVKPSENEAPLVVDADRIELAQSSPKLLKPIGRRDKQIIKPGSGIQHFQLPLGRSREALELTHELIAEQRFGLLVAE
jgi:hypothetical protein